MSKQRGHTGKADSYQGGSVSRVPRLSVSISAALLESFLLLHLACFLLQSMAFVRTCGSWRSQACLAGTSMQSVSQSSVFCTFAFEPQLRKWRWP